MPKPAAASSTTTTSTQGQRRRRFGSSVTASSSSARLIAGKIVRAPTVAIPFPYAGDVPALPSYAYTLHRLDNGLRVVISEDHLAPVVAVNVWYDVGSRHETPGRTGFAHLFEHLMFQGSQNVGRNDH